MCIQFSTLFQYYLLRSKDPPLSPYLSLCLALSLSIFAVRAVLGSSRPIVTNGKQSVEDVHCKRFQLGILFYIWILKFLPHRRHRATGKWTICVCGNWLANIVRPSGPTGENRKVCALINSRRQQVRQDFLLFIFVIYKGCLCTLPKVIQCWDFNHYFKQKLFPTAQYAQLSYTFCQTVLTLLLNSSVIVCSIWVP